jgi:hypothetical protein
MRSCENWQQQSWPYKLLQQIGEGGMGVVFMAEQSEPILRRVARKIINRDVSRYVGDHTI